MERRKRPWLLAVALVGVAAWYLGFTGGGPLERRPVAQPADIVQTYLLNSRSLTYAENGSLTQVM
ncbi:MAG TPA: hypothetical protein DCQ70_11475, partial [Halieaceae bacterium]|nr:hypothetical protein [Halieaceae bacterium]